MTGTPSSPGDAANGPARLVLAVIVAGTLLRLVVAIAMGLGIDESYEVANARNFQLSFFDHPPLSFWMATAAMKLLHSDGGLAVRLPFIAAFAATTWLLYRFTATLFGRPAGAWAALLLNLSPLFSIVAGGWVMPDGPLMLAVMASATCLLPVIAPGDDARTTSAWAAWLGAGAALGCAMLSKYLGVFYAFGVVLFVVTTPDRRHWLLHPAPYIGVGVALAFFIPVIVWNARHDWVSFAFQGSRAASEESALRPDRVLQMIGGQALYLLPWIWWPLVVELVRGLRAGPRAPGRWFCTCCAAPAIALLTIVPLWGSQGLPHWPAVGYLFLFPLLGRTVAEDVHGPKAGFVRGWLRFSVVAFPILVAVLVAYTATGVGQRILPEAAREEDPTRDTLSWKPLEALLRQHGLDERERVVVATLHWIEGAKAGHALGGSWPVTVVSDNPHHFGFLHEDRSFEGWDFVFVGTPERLERLDRVARRFESLEPIGRVWLERLAGPEVEVEAVLARNLRRPFPPPYPADPPAESLPGTHPDR